MAGKLFDNKKNMSLRRLFRGCSTCAPFALIVAVVAGSCARMGQPDGGWYDETPPYVISANPAEGACNVKSQKVRILFNEYVEIDNPTENVIVSPPQMESPDVKSAGKSIVVELKDSLKKNVTYTIDFSDAITDFTESNPLGNYTYSFSTGETVDTLEVSGYVLEAETIEPVKGILVGLYNDLSDTAFTTKPLLRVARTDSRGHYIVRGVAPGKYHVFALMDMDGNYMYSQKSEKLAFDSTVIEPTSVPATRQDTVWRDSLHIASIAVKPYTRFIPDNFLLRTFTPTLTDRYYIKSERTQADNFKLYFSCGDSLPKMRGLNFNATDAFLIETTERFDTITYWLRDTALVNKDTLEAVVDYLMTDTLGQLQTQSDTLQFLSRQTYEKRQKDRKKAFEVWQKKQERLKKKGERYDSIMPATPIEMKFDAPSQLDPDRNIKFTFGAPLDEIDTTKIHLYSKHDTLWYKSRFLFEEKIDTTLRKKLPESLLARRHFELKGEWRPDIEYSLEIDSAAFTDIYGLVNRPVKQGFKVCSLDDYGTLLLMINGLEGKNLIVELLNSQDTPEKRVFTNNGNAEFFYLKEGEYFVRVIVDENGNGKWDTGDFYAKRQPEMVYYYPEAVKIKKKWDVTQNWNPLAKPLNEQKPGKITKQKADKKRTVVSKNAQRAASKGIQYIPGQTAK